MTEYANLVIQRRGLLLALIVVPTLAAALGLARFNVDEDPRDFFRNAGPQWDQLERLFREFGPDDTAAVVVATAEDVFSPAAMEALRDLARRIEDLPEVTAVDSVFRSRRPDLPAAPLIPGTLTAEALRRARERALAHPSVAGLLLSADGDSAFLVIHFADAGLAISRVRPQVEALRAAVAVALAAPALGTVWTLGALGLVGENLGGMNAGLPSLEAVTLDDAGRVPARLHHRYVRADLHRAVVTAYAPDAGAVRLLPRFDRIETGLRALERDHPGFRCDLTGTAVVACRNVYSVITDAARSLVLSSVVIIATMAAAFRSVRLGLICIVPTLFPVVVVAAVLALTGEPLRLSGAIMFSICLGLADDNTIHLVTRFQQERIAGLDVRSAVVRALATCGPAMVITSFTLAAGLTPMLSSPTMPMRIFSQLTITALAASLVADLVILPPLLAWFAEARRRPGPLTT